MAELAHAARPGRCLLRSRAGQRSRRRDPRQPPQPAGRPARHHAPGRRLLEGRGLDSSSGWPSDRSRGHLVQSEKTPVGQATAPLVQSEEPTLALRSSPCRRPSQRRTPSCRRRSKNCRSSAVPPAARSGLDSVAGRGELSVGCSPRASAIDSRPRPAARSCPSAPAVSPCRRKSPAAGTAPGRAWRKGQAAGSEWGAWATMSLRPLWHKSTPPDLDQTAPPRGPLCKVGGGSDAGV